MGGRWGLLRDPYFSPFRVVLFREARLALVLNPKVGSTFLRALLREGLAEAEGRTDPSEGRYPGLKMAREMPVAPIRDYLAFAERPEEWRIHAIVRNPYARAVSAWRDKFHDGHHATSDGRRAGYPRSIRGRVLTEVRRFARARGLPGAAEGEEVPFTSFVAFVEAGRPGRRNHHWETQTRVLMYDRLPFTSVLKMEEGLTALPQILAPLGFDPSWVRAKAGTPANTSSAGRVPVLDAELAAQLREIYASDFAAFGYDPDSWQGR